MRIGGGIREKQASISVCVCVSLCAITREKAISHGRFQGCALRVCESLRQTLGLGMDKYVCKYKELNVYGVVL